MATAQPIDGTVYEATFNAIGQRLQDDPAARHKLLTGIRENLAKIDLAETLESAGIAVEDYLELADLEDTRFQSVGPDDEVQHLVPETVTHTRHPIYHKNEID